MAVFWYSLGLITIPVICSLFVSAYYAYNFFHHAFTPPPDNPLDKLGDLDDEP